MARVVLILLSFFLTTKSIANSCCGQSPASFTVLSLQQKHSLSLSYAFADSAGRVRDNSDEFFVFQDRVRQIQTFKIEVATSIADRHQIFVTSALQRGFFEIDSDERSNTHASDTLLGYTYEVLPEYSFSYWKPRIFLSTMIGLPTGQSVYEPSTLSEGAGVTGHNQWGFGLGLTAKKVYFPLTLTVQLRSLRLLPKNFGTLRVSGFYDTSAALLASYSTDFWGLTVNSGWTWSHLSPRVTPTGTSSPAYNSAVMFGLQKSISDHFSLGMNYSDQTLIGPARNMILNRTLSLNINYNNF